MDTKVFPKRRPRKRQSRNPASGGITIIQSGGARINASPFQDVDLVDVDRLRVPEEGDENGESDGCLRRGDGDDEENHDLPFAGPQGRAVADQREVGGVHHHLDRKEDRDRVAAQEGAGDADREERGGRQEDVVQGNPADHGLPSRRARTKPPTSAARSRTERASKGSRYSEKRSRASGAISAAAGPCEPAGTEPPPPRSNPSSRAAKTTSAAAERKV